jgi:hypothetical protein
MQMPLLVVSNKKLFLFKCWHFTHPKNKKVVLKERHVSLVRSMNPDNETAGKTHNWKVLTYRGKMPGTLQRLV